MPPKPFYCVYYHLRPDGSVFYVGKACSTRRPYTMKRNKHHDSVVSKYGETNIGVAVVQVASETAALSLEISEIDRLRAVGIELTNQTDGGEGVTGMSVSPETREKIRLYQTGKKRTPEAISKTAKAKIGKKLTPEHKAKLSAAKIGVKWDDARKAKLSATKRGRKLSKQHCENISKGQRGRKHTAESKLKMVLAKTGRKASESTKKKMSQTKKGVPWSEARRQAEVVRKMRG